MDTLVSIISLLGLAANVTGAITQRWWLMISGLLVTIFCFLWVWTR